MKPQLKIGGQTRLVWIQTRNSRWERVAKEGCVATGRFVFFIASFCVSPFNGFTERVWEKGTTVYFCSSRLCLVKARMPITSTTTSSSNSKIECVAQSTQKRRNSLEPISFPAAPTKPLLTRKKGAGLHIVWFYPERWLFSSACLVGVGIFSGTLRFFCASIGARVLCYLKWRRNAPFGMGVEINRFCLRLSWERTVVWNCLFLLLRSLLFDYRVLSFFQNGWEEVNGKRMR